VADRAEDRVASPKTSRVPQIDQLERALLDAAQRNELANDALRRYLAEHRGNARAVVDRLLRGEHPWQVLLREQAPSRRESYLQVWREFEETRQQMRRLVIVWAKRRFGVSYRSMGEYLGISEQLATKLGGQAARAHPPESNCEGTTRTSE